MDADGRRARRRPRFAAIVGRSDEQVVEVGSRIHLTMDVRMRRELLPVMYPRLAEWQEVRASANPDGVFRSDLSERLGLA
ncbi:MAG: hypothetical protein WA988_20185 [Candidatus Nanopelagicales bacterium]